MKTKQFFELVLQNAKAGLHAEVSRGFLGVLWWVIEPVMYMGVFYLVFAHVFQGGGDSYVLFLLTGLTAWKWLHATVNTGANSLISGAGLMNQVYLPKIIFPLTTIAVNTFKFFIILSLFLAFLLFMSVEPSWHWGLLPILVLAQFFLILAVTCLIASIMPFFPDLRVILDYILMMLFFLSGVFYDIKSLPTSIEATLQLNPVAVLIEMYRMLLLDGQSLDWPRLFLVFSFSFISFIFSLLIFRRFDRVYPKIIH